MFLIGKFGLNDNSFASIFAPAPSVLLRRSKDFLVNGIEIDH